MWTNKQPLDTGSLFLSLNYKCKQITPLVNKKFLTKLSFQLSFPLINKMTYTFQKEKEVNKNAKVIIERKSNNQKVLEEKKKKLKKLRSISNMINVNVEPKMSKRASKRKVHYHHLPMCLQSLQQVGSQRAAQRKIEQTQRQSQGHGW